jgi:hypothetical protein
LGQGEARGQQTLFPAALDDLIHPRFLMRGTAGAQTEISLATMVYNLKQMRKVLGGQKLAAALAG